jgi:hypothetical protein
MRYSWTALFLLPTCIVPLNAQASRDAPPPVTQSKATRPSAAPSLPPIQLEDQWTTALVKRDTRTFDRLLAPNFVYTENATVMNRGDVIKSVTGPDRVEWARNEGMTVYDFGDVQVITGVLHLRGKGKQGPFDRRYQFTDSWHRQNARIRGDGRIVYTNDSSWQIIAAQDYLIPR